MYVIANCSVFFIFLVYIQLPDNWNSEGQGSYNDSADEGEQDNEDRDNAKDTIVKMTPPSQFAKAPLVKKFLVSICIL